MAEGLVLLHVLCMPPTCQYNDNAKHTHTHTQYAPPPFLSLSHTHTERQRGGGIERHACTSAYVIHEGSVLLGLECILSGHGRRIGIEKPRVGCWGQ
jgi:hypothetical protein